MSDLSWTLHAPSEFLGQDEAPVAAAPRPSWMIWFLVGYIWLFVHRPFEIWPVLATFRIERVYMIATIGCWLVSGASLPRGNRLHAYFTAFVVVLLVSWILSPYQAAGDTTVENYLKYGVFYVLLVTSVRTTQDLRTILIGHFCVLSLLMAHSLREYYNGRHHFAQGIVRLVPVGQSYDYNDLAGLIVCSLPFAWALLREWSGRIMRLILLAHFALACYCVQLTGSRMGFVGLVLASFLACLGSPKRWRLLLLYPVALVVLWTFLPQDRKDRYLTLVDSSSGNRSAAASAGNLRYGGFERALPLFAERPLLGFGPSSFRQAAGSGTLPHNLYGQLLAELGTAGLVTFGLLLWGVARNALDARRLTRDHRDLCNHLPYRTVVAASAAYVLLAIMAWGFNFLFWHVWLWFGALQIVGLRLLIGEVNAEYDATDVYSLPG